MNAAIQAYLARHVAVVLCAEVEVVVTQMINQRVALCGDAPVTNFLRSVRGNLIRNAKAQEIGDKLAHFGADFKDRYQKQIDDTIGAAGIGKLSIAISKRDDASHSTPPDITFKDVEDAYYAALGVVEAVRIALVLPE
jgi:hypothetical protein